MVEELGERADYEDERQRVKCQDEAVLGVDALERRRAAGQVAKYQPHTGAGRRLQGRHQARCPVEGNAHGADVEHDAGNDELHAEAGGEEAHQPCRSNGRAPLRNEPGDQRNGDQPDEALPL